MENWWTAGGSNSRPPRCERGALPTELAAHSGQTLIIQAHGLQSTVSGLPNEGSLSVAFSLLFETISPWGL